MSARQVFVGLAGDADHHAAADLVAHRPRRRRISRRSDRFRPRGGWIRVIQLPVRGLEAQEIAVGPGLAPGPQIRLGPLAEAERHGQGRFPADPPDDAGHPVRA